MFRWVLVKRRVRARRKKVHPAHVAAARVLVHERLAHFNQHYNFRFNRVSIKNQRTRWGSCSKLGNLNFNYKIALLPPQLVDYLIVHELCHLAEFNHSPRFHALVARAVPNHRELRRMLNRPEYHPTRV
jgi:hypothetical protein